MSLPFSKTLRSLDVDRARGFRWLLGASGALLMVWGVWLGSVRIPVYAHTSEATLERSSAVENSTSIHAVAQFPSAIAVGRVQVGQPAVLHLDGFAGAPEGALAATVHFVASEVRDGKVRVELSLPNSTSVRSPLLPGMSGACDVELERVTAATLLLRSAGAGHAFDSRGTTR